MIANDGDNERTILVNIMESKTRHYFWELPEGYNLVKVIDAKDKKTVAILNICSVVIGFGLSFLFFLSFARKSGTDSFIKAFRSYAQDKERIIAFLVFIVCLFAYIVLHELVHGLFYKIFTHEKLTFGLTLSVAYCGVPNLYVKKNPMLLTTLAPFLTFSIILGSALLIVKEPLIHCLIGVLFSVHASGCSGDLWVGFELLTRFRNKDVLMNDTGPKQSFYMKEA